MRQDKSGIVNKFDFKPEEKGFTNVTQKLQETETKTSESDNGSAELSAMIAGTDAAENSEDLVVMEESNYTRASLKAEVLANEDKGRVESLLGGQPCKCTRNLNQAGAIASILSSINIEMKIDKIVHEK